MNDPSPRWLPKMSNHEYHKLKCISSSQVKFFDGHSPYQFYRKFIVRDLPEFEPNESFRFGTLVHMILLEPELFEKSVHVSDLDQRTKEYTSFKRELLGFDKKVTSFKTTSHGSFVNVNGNEIFIVKSDEMTKLKSIKKAVEDHGRASLLLDECEKEISAIARDPETDFFLSIRADAVCRERGYFLDVKTCASLTKSEIESHVYRYKYHLQHAHYMHVGNLIDEQKYNYFYFLFIEKDAPHEIALVHLDPEGVQWSQVKYKSILNKIYEHQNKNDWLPFDKRSGMLVSLPKWRN